MKRQIKQITNIIIFCFLLSQVYGQNVNVDIATERNLMSKNVSSKINADGSPYIDENFSLIQIKQFEGNIYNARYNAYNGEMEVRLSDNKIIALDNNGDYDITFTSNNKMYKTVSYVTDKSIAKRGFVVIVSTNDKYSLYKEEKVQFFEKVEAASSYQQDKPARFKRDDDKYYVKINGEVRYMSQKKKDLLKAFPKESKKLKSYIKSNKLSTKKEKDLIKIAEYISSISSKK